MSQRGMIKFEDKAQISGCKKCCYSMNTCNMQIFNVIDFCLGAVFIAFAIYLYTKIGGHFMDIEAAWLGWCCAILGLLLLLVSLFSFCAITSSDCRWAMHPSRVIALFIAALALSMGCAAFAVQDKFYHYLNDEGDEIGLSSSDVNLIKNWYLLVAYGTFGLVILELLRFKMSGGFRQTALQMDGEFDALLEEDKRNWDKTISKNTEDRSEKYNDLRSYYKNKYKTPPVETVETTEKKKTSEKKLLPNLVRGGSGR